MKITEFSKRVENTVGKGEIAHYEQFLHFSQCFLKCRHIKTRACLGKGLGLGSRFKKVRNVENFNGRVYGLKCVWYNEGFLNGFVKGYTIELVGRCIDIGQLPLFDWIYTFMFYTDLN